MIPFGMGNAIISLISHDKLAWFLEDIDKPEWGIDVRSHDLEKLLIEKIKAFDACRMRIKRQVENAQEKLWGITLENLKEIRSFFNTSGGGK